MKRPFFQIAYKYPPINTVGVLRNEAITAMMHAKGHKGFIVTSTHTPNEPIQSETAELFRVGVLDYRSRGQKNANFSPSQATKRSLAYSIFTKFNNSYPFNLVLGEGALFYIYNAYKKLDQLIAKSGGEGVLISSFRPWADHQVAYLLKRKYPKLIWWCDWRDTPFEKRHKQPIAFQYQLKKLSQLISRADIVTAVSSGVLSDLQPIRADNFTLYNGATNTIDEMSINRKTEASSPSIAYTGSLYGANRNPLPLFRALSQMCSKSTFSSSNFKLVYAGKDEQAWESLLHSEDASLPFQSLGLLQQREALSLQKTAAINVLLTWCNPGQTGGLTMKVFEYLRAGQPILRIHDGPDDEEIDLLLAKAKAPVFTQNTEDNDFAKLKSWIKDQLTNYTINPIAQGFELSETLSQFYDTTLRAKIQNAKCEK